MDNNCMHAVGKLIHSFNPKPFKNLEVATYALSHKNIEPGEFAIAYYHDETDEGNIASIIATGNIHKAKNQIFKNAKDVDKTIQLVKDIAENNSKNIEVLEYNVNSNTANIAYIRTKVEEATDNFGKNSIEINSLKDELNELISELKENINDSIKEVSSNLTDASARIKTLEDWKSLMTSEDVDNTINTFKDVEKFLTSITETNTLTGLLGDVQNNATTTANTYTDTLLSNITTGTYTPAISGINGKIGTINSSVNNLESLIQSLQTNSGSYLTEIPVATNSVVGGIKTGYTSSGSTVAVSLDANNKAYAELTSAAVTSALGFTPIQPNSNGVAYTLPTAADGTLGGIKLGYVPTGANATKQLPVTIDANGAAYVTLTQSAVSSANTYTLPTATNAELGGVKLGYTNSGANVRVLVDDSGNAYVALTETAVKAGYEYTLPTATSTEKGGILLGYTNTGANIRVQANDGNAYVALTSDAVTSALGFTPVAQNSNGEAYTLPTATDSAKGGIKTAFTTVKNGDNAIDFAVKMSGDNAKVPVALTDLESIGVITTNNINSAISAWMSANVKWVTQAEYSALTPVTGTMYYVYE